MTWGHVPVRVILTPQQSDSITAAIEKQVAEAIDQAEKEHPGSMDFLPKTGFSITVWWNAGRLFISLFDLSLTEHKRRGHQDPASVGRENGFDDGPGNPYTAPVLELAQRALKEWPSWLEWRKRRRLRSEPEWLIELKKKQS
jgi:hypothetical protein